MNYAEFSDGKWRTLSNEEKRFSSSISPDLQVFRLQNLVSSGYTPSCTYVFEFEGKNYKASNNRSWKTTKEGMQRLALAGRIRSTGSSIQYVQYHKDFLVKEIANIWIDTHAEQSKFYVVQTSPKVIERCLLMTTDPGDLVLDITCGSGTTAHVAEQWGRRWITCDTSRVAVTLAKQRLMTATFDYYQLANSHEGVGSGFKYKTVPHITLKSIANNPEIREGMNRIEIEQAINKYADQETLYDQPLLDKSRVRVTGPFTVEAVPAPIVKPIDDVINPPVADQSIARSGETLRQSEWRDEMLKTGIRGKNGQYICFRESKLYPVLAGFMPMPKLNLTIWEPIPSKNLAALMINRCEL
jgi:adenine-specific DNA-methyltransferase